MLNAKAGAQQIELMLSCGLARSRYKEPIWELLAVVSESLLNAYRRGHVHCIEKRFLHTLTAVLFFLIFTNTQRVARSMAMNT